MRAQGAGIPAFLIDTGIDTVVEHGGLPQKYWEDGETIEKYGDPKPVREFNGKRYIMEKALGTDYSFIKAHVADEIGNVMFNKGAWNFNSDVAMAGKICICEVEEIVPVGTLKPESIDLPGIFIKRLIKGSGYSKKIDRKVVIGEDGKINYGFPEEEMKKREIIARRAAEEIKDGDYITLGNCIPTHITSFLNPRIKVTVLGENGVLGMGPPPKKDEVDPDLINPSKETITIMPGASFFKTSDSFNMIRGGHVHQTFLGGLLAS